VSYEHLRCQDFVELASDYLEATLSPEQRLTVERHLAFCDPCGDYLEDMRATIRVAGSLREEDVPEPVADPLVQAFKALRGNAG